MGGDLFAAMAGIGLVAVSLALALYAVDGYRERRERREMEEVFKLRFNRDGEAEKELPR